MSVCRGPVRRFAVADWQASEMAKSPGAREARPAGSAEEGGRSSEAGRRCVRRLHPELERRLGQRRCDRHHAGRREHHRCHHEDDECRCRLGGQRRIDGRMRVVPGVAICTRHRRCHETTDVNVIVRLIVRSPYGMGVTMLGRRVGLGLVFVRMAMRQRRGRRGEPSRERESKRKQT